MHSRHLSKKRYEWLDEQLGETAHRLCLIHGQMKEPQGVKLYRLVNDAYNAV